jgi:hypothetical protein
MDRNTRNIEKQTVRTQKIVGAPAERQKQVLSRSARVIQRHARNLAKLEAKYRVEIHAMVEHSKRLIQLTPADEDLTPIVSSM